MEPINQVQIILIGGMTLIQKLLKMYLLIMKNWLITLKKNEKNQ